METIESIKKKLDQFGWDGGQKFFGQKEIKALPEILQNDEDLLFAIQGTYNDKQGILFLTQSRIVFVDKGFFFGITLKSFPLSQVSAVEYGTGLMFGEVTIYSTGATAAVIKQTVKHMAKKFAVQVTPLIGGNKQNVTTPITSSKNIVAELEQLADLRDRGILTDSEFQEQKIKILNH